MESGSVTVEVDPDDVPENSEVCLVNDDTGEEMCEPVDGTQASARDGMLAFRQASTITITFTNVPPGNWTLVLRVPGFQDLVLEQNVIVAADQVTDAGSVPVITEQDLTPITEPTSVPPTATSTRTDDSTATAPSSMTATTVDPGAILDSILATALPTQSEVLISGLPSTGSNSGDPGNTSLLLLIAGASAIFFAVAAVAPVATQRKKAESG